MHHHPSSSLRSEASVFVLAPKRRSELPPRIHPQLREHPLAVPADRMPADVESSGDLPVP